MARVPPVQVGGANNARSAAAQTAVATPSVQFGDQLAGFFDQLAAQAKEDEIARDRLKSVQVEEGYKRKTQEAVAELDPLQPDYANRVQEVVTTNREEALNATQFETQEVLDDLQIRLTQQSEGTATVALARRREAIQKEALETFRQLSDRTLSDIKNDPTAFDDYLREFQTQAERTTSSLPASVRNALAEQFGDRAVLAQIEGLARSGQEDTARAILKENEGALSPDTARNAGRLIREIENENRQAFLARTSVDIADVAIEIDDASTVQELAGLQSRVELMDRRGMFEGRQSTRAKFESGINARRKKLRKQAEAQSVASSISDLAIAVTDATDINELTALRDQVEQSAKDGLFKGQAAARPKLIAAIEAKKKRLALSGTAVDVADTAIDISDAEDLDELAGLRARVEAQAEQGLFENREDTRARLIGAINSKRAAIIKTGRDLTKALAKRSTGSGLDTQKEADLVYAREVLELGDEPEPGEVIQHAVEFASTTGWVPTAQKRVMQNAERVEDPELLAQGAALAARINEKAPAVKTGGGARIDTTLAVSEITGVGLQEAAKMVIDRIPDSATVKERDAQFNEEFKNFDARSFLRSEDLAASSTLGVFGTDTEIPSRIAMEAESTLRTFYRLFGDADVATKAAVNSLSRRYGETRVGGTPALVENPPERFFPGAANVFLSPEQKAVIIDGEIKRTFGVMGIRVPEGPDDLGAPAFSLVSDRVTKETAATGTPSYEVRVRNNLGIMVPLRVLTDNGTQVLRYTVPSVDQLTLSPEYQGIVDNEAKRLKQERERNERIEGRDRSPSLLRPLDEQDFGPSLQE